MEKLHTKFDKCIEVGDKVSIFYKIYNNKDFDTVHEEVDNEMKHSDSGIVIKLNDIGLMIIREDDIGYMRENILKECVDDKTACALFIPWDNIHIISLLVLMEDNYTVDKLE